MQCLTKDENFSDSGENTVTWSTKESWISADEVAKCHIGATYSTTNEYVISDVVISGADALTFTASGTFPTDLTFEAEFGKVIATSDKAVVINFEKGGLPATTATATLWAIGKNYKL